VHQGDSLPLSFLQNVEPPLKDREQAGLVDKAKNAAIVPATLGPWLVKHREAVSEPLISGFINTVRQIPGTNKVGAIGFCWGGRYAILQAHGKKEGSVGGVDAAYACHPSLVAIPGDFEPVTMPLNLALGDKDSLLDEKSIGQIQDLLAKKTDVPHEIRVRTSIFCVVSVSLTKDSLCRFTKTRSTGSHFEATGAAIKTRRQWTMLRSKESSGSKVGCPQAVYSTLVYQMIRLIRDTNPAVLDHHS
jgi:hypothetical protein